MNLRIEFGSLKKSKVRANNFYRLFRCVSVCVSVFPTQLSLERTGENLISAIF